MLPESRQKFSAILFWLLVVQLCVISISIAAASIVLALAIALVVTWALIEKKNILPKNPLDYFLLAYIIIEFITAIFSTNVPEAFRNSKRLLLLIMIYAVLLSFTSQSKMKQALLVICTVVSLQSLFEISAYFSLGEDRLHLFQHYMTTGGIKMILCLTLIPHMIDPKTIMKHRLVYAGIFVPIFVALILTNTRSSWLGFVAGTIVIGVLQYRKTLYVLAALIVAFFLFGPHSQVDRAKSIVDMSQQSNFGRIHMWETGLKIWKDHPVVGTGDIDLHILYEHYKQPDDIEYGGHLHNNFVHLFVTLGVVGFIVVMALWWKVWTSEYEVFAKNQNDSLIKNISLGGMAVFAGFLVNGLFEWNFGDHEIMIFVWFTVGLVLSAGRTNQKEIS